ncbi:MAG TPA: trifunctional glycosyltransferase/class I SAM-dependent methyltransferase/polysaccharide deacetylase [Candidatus Limnocylindrales bacterium]|nr:trifunctional glycosyltransferase/class I SAM-dependent methyltransferase/polysaccharide deacetylase [Candidatus Limnocylindrales bacterium]
MRPSVSVIIPAHNAADTLAQTLESLLVQTVPDWEAIVVDDGSTDRTAFIATSFAERDPRIRTVSQLQKGAGAARNAGIRLAHFDWLLFLDADDWILPPLLERLTDGLIADPGLDAVHCGWARIAPNGEVFSEEGCTLSGDLFAKAACRCPFVIHSCIVRRSLVEMVGGFDSTFQTCEDWDLWQRIARTGARFGRIPDVLSRYRMRGHSLSSNVHQMLTDGLRVITLGHSRDPRVPNPDPAHMDGLPVENLSVTKALFVIWWAFFLIGCGQNPKPLLGRIKENRYLPLDPPVIAQMIFTTVPLALYKTPSAWVELWPSLARPIEEFLLSLEELTSPPGLMRRCSTILERLILDYWSAHIRGSKPQTLSMGTTHAVRIEVTEPIPDLIIPAPAERLHCTVELEGKSLGVIELPICDELVSAQVLTDAIAAKFFWPILGKFFERTIYPGVEIRETSKGLSVWRGAVLLAEGLPKPESQTFFQEIHDQIGWTLFLQEIWARPDWTSSHFYDPQSGDQPATRRHRVAQTRNGNNWLTLEVSGDLPDVEIMDQKLKVIPTVGGTALGIVTISVKGNLIRAQELRAVLTTVGGLELCRMAVREGLIGRPFEEAASLRTRLASVAQKNFRSITPKEPKEVLLVPDWTQTVARALSWDNLIKQPLRSVILARRAHGRIGTSVCRRALLPAAAAPDLIKAALAADEPVIQIHGLNKQSKPTVHLQNLLRQGWNRIWRRNPGYEDTEPPGRVIYVPDLLWQPCRHTSVSPVETKGSDEEPSPQKNRLMGGSSYDRHFFETIFVTQSDPWRYTHPYEQTKYEQTLALLPTLSFDKALELACAEGHFTVQLAPRVRSLMAADISQTALDRAAARCSNCKNVQFIRLDLTKDPLPGRFNLIVCSEVLYYVGRRDSLEAVARKLADALEPGGYLISAHANLVVDEPDRTGFDWNHPFGAKVIGEVLASTPPLRLVKELRTPLYRIQLFQRQYPIQGTYELSSHGQNTPEIIELPQSTPLPPHVAARVLWQGGRPKIYGPPPTTVTDRLPILLYHRITPDSSSLRYCVTPQMFEEQIRYLHETGFYSIRLEDWHTAMETRRPLPGRAILLTFDDGYADFLTYAWPVLKRYGFSAMVFLVAEEIGRLNRWELFYGEAVPLLHWDEIHQLQKEGVEFGAHSATHRPLTALSITEIVREGARSRAILQRGLGRPVTSFAYPYGEVDPVVQHLIGACGYIFGLSCRPERSRFQDSLLELPRIEVTGSDNLQTFISKLSIKPDSS